MRHNAPGDGGRKDAERRRLVCRGVVQGVGFRPAVHRLALDHGLGGFVRNGPEGVVIEVEGTPDAVAAFVDALPRSLPPLARLESLESTSMVAGGERVFRVLESDAGRRSSALVPPDSALCADCRREMADPTDRRFRYAFTTCTNCGPRFTLVRELPYDRQRTSMSCFPLCPECRREYEDPHDRRFHAEPVCCPTCGPRLWLARQDSGDRGSGTEGDAAAVIGAARQALLRGEIVAVKGLGGFQLACRGDDEAAVRRLRERKRRPTKPLAVMVRNLDVARRLVALDEAAEALLVSPQAPIVLAPRLAGAAVATGVAPGLGDLGVLLPTAPLHVELFRDAALSCLVMTSGNAADEPIAIGNREAGERLKGIADALLLHDRDVLRRADDSVARSGADGPFLVRRARGYVPAALPLPVPTPTPVLAMGGYLQTTACLAIGDQALFTPHVGDLDNAASREFLLEAASGLEELLQTRASVIVVDEHPDYPSRWLGELVAARRGGRVLPVQHHLAHGAGVLAEHGCFPALGERALAVALDGTGWGDDGTVWGGEWLTLGGDLGWRRLASLELLPLVGGEAAVREPWRVAVAALVRSGHGELVARTPLAGQVDGDRLRSVVGLAEQEDWPRASGAGRVFEAVGALVGLVAVNGYEGEAAARLEALAVSAAGRARSWPEVEVRDPEPGHGVMPVLPSRALLVAAARRLADGEPPEAVAAGFHVTFCALVAELTSRVAPPGGQGIAVGFGGGCLVNRLLRDGLRAELQSRGFGVLLPMAVPPGDGGLAYGQAVLGAVACARGSEPRHLGGDRCA